MSSCDVMTTNRVTAASLYSLVRERRASEQFPHSPPELVRASHSRVNTHSCELWKFSLGQVANPGSEDAASTGSDPGLDFDRYHRVRQRFGHLFDCYKTKAQNHDKLVCSVTCDCRSWCGTAALPEILTLPNGQEDLFAEQDVPQLRILCSCLFHV